MEGGAGIQQVLMAVPHFQCAEYLFEKIVYRACGLSGKVRGQFSFEMYPVNCPGIILVRTVSVRNSRRQYEILICFYRTFLFTDAEPSGSLYTINKNELADRFRAFPEMMQGFRIITYVCNMQNR